MSGTTVLQMPFEFSAMVWRPPPGNQDGFIPGVPINGAAGHSAQMEGSILSFPSLGLPHENFVQRSFDAICARSAGQGIQTFFPGYGRRFIFNGILPAFGCKFPHARVRRHGGTLGWPCWNGGSVGVTVADQGMRMRCCMLFFLPISIDGEPVLRFDGTESFLPSERYEAARDNCKRHVAWPVDLTEMAWCIHLNYPRVQNSYPPPPERSDELGNRLRGVVVLPSSDGGRLPRDVAFRFEGGALVVDPFEMSQSNPEALVIHLHCICAIS